MVWCMGLRPLACWDFGFESRHGHGCLSVANVVYCEVEVSATGRSLVQMSPTECGVCLWVWLSATITLYTYNEQVERGQNKKARKKERKKDKITGIIIYGDLEWLVNGNVVAVLQEVFQHLIVVLAVRPIKGNSLALSILVENLAYSALA
jgi:hypothetical protein